MSFIFATCDNILVLEADDSHILNWHIDAAHPAHLDSKSCVDSIFTMRKGSIVSSSAKQKCDTRSATESELNSAELQPVNGSLARGSISIKQLNYSSSLNGEATKCSLYSSYNVELAAVISPTRKKILKLMCSTKVVCYL